MTSLINEAYAAVEHAPLRYYIESYNNQMEETNKQTPSSWANERTRGTPRKFLGPTSSNFGCALPAEDCSEYS